MRSTSWHHIERDADTVPELAAAAAALERATRPGDLLPPFLDVLSVAGVGISTLGDPFGSETVSASSVRAARLDEVQIDLGEGPCWEALADDHPVLTSDVRTAASERWPTALATLQDLDFRGVFAFPMRVGTIPVGAVDLYTDAAVTPSASFVADAVTLTAIAARQVLRRALLDAGVERGETPPGRYSRREVHQASGMISAQLAVSVADALLILRGHAYASGRTVIDVAADVIARRLDLSSPNPSES